MLGNRFESSGKLRISPRTFQRVEAPSGMVPEGLQSSVEFLEPHQVESVGFRTLFSI